ncbi:hypothetical protein TDB9533_02336 [Thalassocella blandensis]|nr:hypothetical protein TDB9533_02336 [Thalassocella blandensis]
MPIQDFNPKFQIALSFPRSFRVLCLAAVCLALALLLSINTTVLFKILVCVLFLLSCIPVANFIVMLQKIEGFCVEGGSLQGGLLEGDSFERAGTNERAASRYSVLYAGASYPVEIHASPIVTSWLIYLPLRQTRRQTSGRLRSLLAELVEWLMPVADEAPEFFPLIIMTKSGDLAAQAKLRAHLLTKSC